MMVRNSKGKGMGGKRRRRERKEEEGGREKGEGVPLRYTGPLTPVLCGPPTHTPCVFLARALVSMTVFISTHSNSFPSHPIEKLLSHNKDF